MSWLTNFVRPKIRALVKKALGALDARVFLFGSSTR